MARLLCSAGVSLPWLKDPVPTQRFQEFVDIRPHDIGICAVRRADLRGYLVLVTSRANEFENLRPHGIEREHLALLDFEQDRAIRGFGSPDRAGDREHRNNRPLPGMSAGGFGYTGRRGSGGKNPFGGRDCDHSKDFRNGVGAQL